jgi:hypothetical protein
MHVCMYDGMYVCMYVCVERERETHHVYCHGFARLCGPSFPALGGSHRQGARRGGRAEGEDCVTVELWRARRRAAPHLMYVCVCVCV